MASRVETVTESSNAAAAGRTRDVLDYVQGLLAAPARELPSPGLMLKELAQAFGACGAGWAAPLTGTPVLQQRIGADAARTTRWPWEDQPQLLNPLQRNLTGAITCAAKGRSLLLAALPEESGGRLFWLEAEEGRCWTAADEAALLLAVRVVAPLLPLEKSGNGKLGLDQPRLRQRLQDAGTISGRIAHAFDNIMTGILGFAELTIAQTDPRSPQQQYLGEVIRAAQQGVQLTQQLHFFSRCAVPTAGPATLSYVVGEEESRLRQVLPSGVSLKIDVAADLAAVAIDAELLRTVVAHLLNNALEAISGNGAITLSARRSELKPDSLADLYGNPSFGPCVEVVVTNTGAPISAEVRGRLFREPFFSTKPRHRGLGLAIVYRILHAHRGGFQLESPDDGTAVHVYLPLTS
jgi:signal transduction histidine kinase